MAENTEPVAPAWRTGQLAEHAGITVRTLHHWDVTGLLRPSDQTAGGHRLYRPLDVVRLYRILALRRLGFGLAEIRSLLDDPGWDLRETLTRHAEEATRTATAATRLAARLRAIVSELDGTAELSSENLLSIIEEMSEMDTPARGTTTLLVYEDLEAAHTYLSTTYDLSPGRLTHAPDGRVVHAELFAGDLAIWLHPPGDGFRSPRQVGAATGMTAVEVDDADQHHARSVERGADIVEEPMDAPYGVREYGARDLEGHLWYFQSPLT